VPFQGRLNAGLKGPRYSSTENDRDGFKTVGRSWQGRLNAGLKGPRYMFCAMYQTISTRITSSVILIQLHGRSPAIAPVTPLATT